MGSAHSVTKREVADRALPAGAPCVVSPHCKLPPPLAVRFGGLDGLWLHYGPIGADTTTLTVHRAERSAFDRNDGALEVETRPGWRAFLGCHLDVFVLAHKPGDGARRHVQPLGGARDVSWRVFAVAWCDDGDTYVSWIAPGMDLPYEGYAQFSGSTRPTATTQATFDRLLDLLDGGRVRRGRPARGRDPIWLDIAARAMQRKLANPSLPWKSIASALNIPERTLREYRRVLEREPSAVGLHFVDDGGD